MSSIFINAKTEMICDTISAALEDAGARISCCLDGRLRRQTFPVMMW